MAVHRHRFATPRQAADSVVQGEADIAIATEALDKVTELACFPCFSWRHIVIAPKGHELVGAAATLDAIANFPLITYSPEFSGRSQIDAVFAERGLEPDVRLVAMDADIIKAYVARGLGLGIVAEMAIEPGDTHLVELPGSRDLFSTLTAKLAVHRGALLHDYAYRFIEILAPHLKPNVLRGETTPRVDRPNSARPSTGALAEWRRVAR